MDDGIGLPQVVEELVPEATPLVRIRYKSGDIDDIHRDEPDPVGAAGARHPEPFARACGPDISDPEIRVDSGEGVISDLGMRHCCGTEERGFSAIWFSCKGKCNHSNSL
jgi:hypothetical protein